MVMKDILPRVQCNDFTFLSTKKESGNNAAANEPIAQNPVADQPSNSETIRGESDDLPF